MTLLPPPISVSQDRRVHTHEYQHLCVTGSDVHFWANAVPMAIREWMCNALLIPAK